MPELFLAHLAYSQIITINATDLPPVLVPEGRFKVQVSTEVLKIFLSVLLFVDEKLLLHRRICGLVLWETEKTQ